MTLSLVQKCGITSLLCSLWNLFGDIYFLDFYIAHMDDEKFAMVRPELRQGYIFSFEARSSLWLMSLAQAAGSWRDLQESSSIFFRFLEMAQTSLIQHLFIGCLPGFMALNVATVLILFVVQTKLTKFPTWIHLCNPIMTMIWVSILGSMLPDPWGFYIVGSMGTWGVMVLNLAVSYVLWDDHSAEILFAPFLSKTNFLNVSVNI
mmetsp:Transcript_16762/g.22947  ORF Transcript_16762/g.22947 Transcript_16762/m.22947 type:complete len:205 (-) Transcript_16762:168-782(-)